MIRITRRATQHLDQLRSQKGLDASARARFVRHDGRLALTFAKAPERGDRVVSRDDIQVYLAPGVTEDVQAAVIDTTTRDRRTRLVLRRSAGG